MTNSNIPLGAVRRLVDYLYHDEEKHYLEMRENEENTSSHIFNAVRAVTDWLDKADPVAGSTRTKRLAPRQCGVPSLSNIRRNQMHFHREERDDFVRHLAVQFPKCFFEQPELRRPLKRNIIDDLEERKVLNRDKCLAAVNWYESSFTYCYGIIAGAERVDLDGRIVGKVTEQEQEKTRKWMREKKQELSDRRAVPAPVVIQHLTRPLMNGAHSMKKSAPPAPPPSELHPAVTAMQSGLAIVNNLMSNKQDEALRPVLATAALREVIAGAEKLISDLGAPGIPF